MVLRQNSDLLWLLILLTAAWSASAESVPVSRFGEAIELGVYAQKLQDPQSTLDIAQVQTQTGWQPLNSESFSAGFDKASWWLRVTLHNDTAQVQHYVLDTVSSVADFLDIYQLEQGRLISHLASGDRRPFASRVFPTRTVTQPLSLAPDQQLELYLRVASWDGLHEVIRLRVLSASAFAAQQQTQSLALGVYYGTLLAILLYNLFLFIFIRERVFGLYVFYVAAFILWSYVLRGYGLQYLWPQAPHFNNQILPISAMLCYISFGLFALDYLEIKTRAPQWLYQALRWAIGVNLLVCTPAFFGYYALTFAISLPAGVLMVILAVTSGVLMMQRGSRAAKYFLLAFGFLAAGVLLYYLQLTGAIASGPVPEYGIQVFSALEVLLLAFGLADQMNSLKADKLKAERAARQAQHQLATRLGDEVRQRTAELEQANLRLEQLATTDELTGTLNRRRFNQMFEHEVNTQHESGQLLAFGMIDIDAFKRYNDLAGHQAGDQILHKISHAMQQQLQTEGAYLFRLGGEEFGLLLTRCQDADEACGCAEALRSTIENLAIEHPAPDIQLVTASFGLIICLPDATLNQAQDLYRRADELLYQAKSAGRNRVVSAQL